jgi:hypothetical protein
MLQRCKFCSGQKQGKPSSPPARRGRRTARSFDALIETCKLNGVDPQTYVADVLTKIVNLWPAWRIDDLMSWEWGLADRIAAAEQAAA